MKYVKGIIGCVCIALFLSLAIKGKRNPVKNRIKLCRNPGEETRFTGNYNREFNDFPDVHLASAIKNGIKPWKREMTHCC